MIDIATETVLSLSEAREKLPRRRKNARPDLATMYRWWRQGIRGIRLETIMVGATRCTSIEALQRFFNALTAAAEGSKPAPQTPQPKHRRSAIAAAERRLALAGINP